jgi:hypothetical protein
MDSGTGNNMEAIQPETPDAPASSLAGRLTNIFVSPSEVFDEIKTSKRNKINWIVPLVLIMIVGVLYTVVVMGQSRIIQGMKDAQEKKFQEMVTAGKITQKQADDMLAAVEKFMNPAFLKIVGCASAVGAKAAMMFFVAFILWLLGRFAFHSEFEYMQALEVTGLATMINVFGGIVAMLLAIIYGSMSITPGPALLVSHFDMSNKVHLLLSVLSVPTLWYVSLLSLGLARLTGGGFVKAALWLYGIWAFFTIGPILAFGGR